MAYFRCGGGGIPSSLKSGMNDVLNKKFGTSTTYPPSDWPSDVNLLGPLPIKTASGAIASFSDGADDVPISDCKFYFNPKQAQGTPSPSNPRPLVGYTGMTIKQTGKNLIRLDSNTLVEAYNSTATYIDNGAKVEATGTYSRAVWKIPTKIGVTYTVSYKGLRNNGYGRVYYSWEYSTTSRYGLTILTETETSYSFTFTAEHDYLYFYIYNTASGNSGHTTVKDVQVEVGSTATAYSAYKSKTPITVSLGRTVYGGYVTKDKVVKTFGYANFQDLTWQKHSTAPNTYLADLSTIKAGSASVLVNAYCSAYVVVTRNNQSGQTINYSISASNVNGGRLFVLDDSYSSLEDFQEGTKNYQLAYELATPIEYDITALNLSTYYGDNNFWSEGDTASVDYRADIALALGQ